MVSMLQNELVLLEKTLRVSLSDRSTHSFSSSMSSVVPLPGAKSEISGFQGKSLTENLTVLDSILFERLGIPQTNILEFCTDAFFTIRDEMAKEWSVRTENAKKLLGYLQEILVSYAALSLSEPDMFPEQHPPSDLEGIALSAWRLLNFLESGGAPDFLKRMAEYWETQDPDFRTAIFLSVLEELGQKMATVTMFDDPETYAGILKTLLELKGVMQVFFDLSWVEEHWKGDTLESSSALGPYFSPSYFPKPESLSKIPGMPEPPDHTREKVSSYFEVLRSRSEYEKIMGKFHQEINKFILALTAVVKQLLRGDKDKTLQWLSAVVTKNTGKAKLGNRLQNPVEMHASRDGFCINVLDVMLELCKPFLDPKDPKASKIDQTYLAYDPKMKGLEETPLCSSAEKLPPKQLSFGTITEFYWICVEMFHFAWNTIRENYMDLNRMLSRFRSSSHPQAENEFKYFIKIKLCYDVYLMDSSRNLNLLKLCNLTMHLLLKWVGFENQLPLGDPPQVLGSIPEHVVEDIGEFLIIINELQSEIFRNLGTEELVNLMNFTTVVLSSPEHFSNPYLRAKLVQSLSMVIENGVIGDVVSIIDMSEVAHNHLLYAMVVFYVDIEFTGSSSQFYDKFQYRHFASKIFNFLWKFEKYQEKTKGLHNEEYFARFINMLLNDTNWCLDEGLKKLTEIKKFKTKKLLEEVTKEEEEENSKNEGYCKYVLQQANESIGMLKQVAEWNSSLFLKEEFSDRTAMLLNYFLKQLCGPKCLELKVEDPKQYNFQPEELLKNIIELYLNIGKHPNFKHSIVRDERSYSSDAMHKALRVCYKRPILLYEQVQEFEKFIKEVKETAMEQKTTEDILGEIPDEFLCAISYDLMKNPVKLPSGVVVDRSSISRHLLSDQHDPFSRAPLTQDMLEEETELKQKIDQWVSEKLG